MGRRVGGYDGEDGNPDLFSNSLPPSLLLAPPCQNSLLCTPQGHTALLPHCFLDGGHHIGLRTRPYPPAQDHVNAFGLK